MWKSIYMIERCIYMCTISNYYIHYLCIIINYYLNQGNNKEISQEKKYGRKVVFIQRIKYYLKKINIELFEFATTKET